MISPHEISFVREWALRHNVILRTAHEEGLNNWCMNGRRGDPPPEPDYLVIAEEIRRYEAVVEAENRKWEEVER